MSTTIKVRALRAVGAGGGRFLVAGEVAEIDAVAAAALVQMGRAALLDEGDRPKLRVAVQDDTKRVLREAGRQPSRTGDAWTPIYR